eukprot:11157743-Ditylum_brightwellii.AAC.1
MHSSQPELGQGRPPFSDTIDILKGVAKKDTHTRSIQSCHGLEITILYAKSTIPVNTVRGDSFSALPSH